MTLRVKVAQREIIMKKMILGALLVVAFWASEKESQAGVEVSTLKIANTATLKFNGLLQAWSLGNQTASSKNQSFRLRRAELKASGTVLEQTRFFLMIDPAKLIPPPGGTRVDTVTMIQDFGLGYKIVPELELSIGQFKTPTTAEGLDSSGELPLPERSLMGRTYGDKRELGIKLGYKTSEWNAATMVSTAQPFYGKGQHGLTDASTRVEITPMKDFGVGTFVTLGDFEYKRKGRWGLNSRYKIESFDLRAEYAQGRDSAVQSHGLTTEAGYWVTENIEPIVRYEVFKGNQALTSYGKAETLGVNYFVREYNCKVQLIGTAMQNMAAPNGSPAATPGTSNRLVMLALQTSI